MNKIKQKIGAAAAGLALAGGLAVGGTVVTAEPAQAWTQSCKTVDAGYGYTLYGSPWPGYRYATACYVDYSWWEEVSFPWPHDQWFFSNYRNYR